MGDCCNARTLSYVSASFQMLGVFLLLLFVALFGFVVSHHEYPQSEEANVVVALGAILCIIILIVCVIEFILLVTLFVGIKQNRLALVSAYVYPTMFFMVLMGLNIIYRFIKGFVDQYPVGNVFLGLFYNLMSFGITVLMFSPIFIFHQRLRNPRFQPEQHDLRANQPVHKPQYIA